MSLFIRSFLVAAALLGTVSAASANPVTWNPDTFFEELRRNAV